MTWLCGYLWGALGTGCYLMGQERPVSAGSWLAFSGLVLAWPALFLFALFHLIMRAPR